MTERTEREALMQAEIDAAEAFSKFAPEIRAALAPVADEIDRLRSALKEAEREREEARDELIAEKNRLLAKIDLAEEEVGNARNDQEAAESRASALEATLAECETALSFYGNRDVYWHGKGYQPEIQVDQNGDRARSILTKLHERKETRA